MTNRANSQTHSTFICSDPAVGPPQFIVARCVLPWQDHHVEIAQLPVQLKTKQSMHRERSNANAPAIIPAKFTPVADFPPVSLHRPGHFGNWGVCCALIHTSCTINVHKGQNKQFSTLYPSFPKTQALAEKVSKFDFSMAGYFEHQHNHI